MNDNSRFWKEYEISSQTVLDPASRNLEVMFGIIMALSFTSTVSIAHDGNAELHHFLWAILGCNIAWGFIDGLTFMISGIIERTRKDKFIQLLRNSKSKAEGIAAARQELQPLVAAIISNEQLEHLYDKLMALPPPPARLLFLTKELNGAFTIFLINFFATLPVALPFIFLDNTLDAKLISDAISLTILFICGYSTGKYSGLHPVFCGLAMIFLGSCFLMITELLGG